jgi:LytS/YehU family sensor histidine kinase
MILQPFVENSIKHGFRQLEETGRRGKIVIRFEAQSGYLECMVSDNGIGRKKASTIQQQTPTTKHVSAALEITQERLELMGVISNKKSIEIIDIEVNGEAHGTKVLVRIPLV